MTLLTWIRKLNKLVKFSLLSDIVILSALFIIMLINLYNILTVNINNKVKFANKNWSVTMGTSVYA